MVDEPDRQQLEYERTSTASTKGMKRSPQATLGCIIMLVIAGVFVATVLVVFLITRMGPLD